MATLLYIDRDETSPRWRDAFERAGLAVLAPESEEQAITALVNADSVGVVLLDPASTGVAPRAFARIMDEESAGPRPELIVFADASALEERVRMLRDGVDCLLDRSGPEPEILAVLHAALSRAARVHKLYSRYKKNAAAQVVDVETGLYNLRYLRLRVREEVERSVREHRPLSLILVDLASVREVQSELGSTVANALLKELVARVKKALRPYDVICRVGPERVGVLLTDMEPLVAYTLAKRMVEALRAEPVALSPPDLRDPIYRDVRVRMAVAGLRGDEQDANPGELLTALEHALRGEGDEPVVVAKV